MRLLAVALVVRAGASFRVAAREPAPAGATPWDEEVEGYGMAEARARSHGVGSTKASTEPMVWGSASWHRRRSAKLATAERPSGVPLASQPEGKAAAPAPEAALPTESALAPPAWGRGSVRLSRRPSSGDEDVSGDDDPLSA